MKLEDALGHIGAYLEGGDEMGIVSDEAAEEAYETITQEIDRLTRENASLRRQLAELPREEIARLHDAYTATTAGWEPGKAEHFPAVLRYLFDTQGAEVQP